MLHSTRVMLKGVLPPRAGALRLQRMSPAVSASNAAMAGRTKSSLAFASGACDRGKIHPFRLSIEPGHTGGGGGGPRLRLADPGGLRADRVQRVPAWRSTRCPNKPDNQPLFRGRCRQKYARRVICAHRHALETQTTDQQHSLSVEHSFRLYGARFEQPEKEVLQALWM